MIDDATLLRRYAAERAEEAFAEFVRRHLPLVYSAAVRRLGGDAHRAEDVAQVVFCAVARNAHRLASRPVLTGWLYTATRNAVIDAIRAEKRRRAREEEAHIMEETSSAIETPADWSRLRPVLDAAMDELGGDDREAVLLRFFQGRPFAEIGTTLGLSEDGARKRVDRALDKLRVLLRRHRIASTSVALAALLASETISAAPANLAASVTGAALAKAGASAGALAFVSMAKLWVGIGAAVSIGGVIGVISQQSKIAELRGTEAQTQQQLAKFTAENARLAEARAALEKELTKVRADFATANGSLAEARAAAAHGTPKLSGTGNETPEKRQQLDKLHQRFDGFVRQRGLTPEQADKLFEILGDWDAASRDFQASIRAQGLTATPETQKLRDRLQQQIEVEPLVALLGRDGERAYFDFERTTFYQAIVEPLAQKLANNNLPLRDDERTRLAALVESNTHSVKRDPTAMGSEAVVDWTPVLATAGGFLNPTQLALMKAQVSRQSGDER